MARVSAAEREVPPRYFSGIISGISEHRHQRIEGLLGCCCCCRPDAGLAYLSTARALER